MKYIKYKYKFNNYEIKSIKIDNKYIQVKY